MAEKNNTINNGKGDNTTMELNRKSYQGIHTLANNYTVSTDTWSSGRNNNVLVIGPSGAGKTRSYIRPNLMKLNESFIILDTKGNLYKDYAKYLEENGYVVENINFANFNCTCGYNPLDLIHYKDGAPSMADIMKIGRVLVPETAHQDRFWDDSARQVIEMLICYVKEALIEEEQNLESVSRLATMIRSGVFAELMKLHNHVNPDSESYRRYSEIATMFEAERTISSVQGIVNTYLSRITFSDTIKMYNNPRKIDFKSIGREKTAVFLTISDVDRSMDALSNLFMSQALQELVNSADNDYEDNCLDVPVRLYLDDFATNMVIPDFDKTISVIRSREIYVSIILQSITQLHALYGEYRANTIVNNCDYLLYLGGQDLETTNYISQRIDKSKQSILNMPLDKVWVLARGGKAKLCDKVNVNDIEQYQEMICNKSRVSGTKNKAEMMEL